MKAHILFKSALDEMHTSLGELGVASSKQSFSSDSIRVLGLQKVRAVKRSRQVTGCLSSLSTRHVLNEWRDEVWSLCSGSAAKTYFRLTASRYNLAPLSCSNRSCFRHDTRFDDVQSKKKDTGMMSDYLFRDTFKASEFKLLAEACCYTPFQNHESFCLEVCFLEL